MSNELTNYNLDLIQYLLGYDTMKNFTYVLRDALSDEDCRWTVDDVKVLAEYLESHWGIHLPEHCDKVIEEWREKNEAE